MVLEAEDEHFVAVGVPVASDAFEHADAELHGGGLDVHLGVGVRDEGAVHVDVAGGGRD